MAHLVQAEATYQEGTRAPKLEKANKGGIQSPSRFCATEAYAARDRLPAGPSYVRSPHRNANGVPAVQRIHGWN